MGTRDTQSIILPLFVKPVLSHLVFLITLRDECGDRFFSFFLSFVLSFFFRSIFNRPTVFILCSFLIIARYYYKTLRGEKKKRGGTRKKKIREKRQKEGFGDENTNGKERGASFENTMVQQKEKDDHKKVHTSFSRCVLYTLFP